MAERLVDIGAGMLASAREEAARAGCIVGVGLEDVLKEAGVDFVAQLWCELVEDADVDRRVVGQLVLRDGHFEW